MDRTRLADWVEAYERAWPTAGADSLSELFTEDASYSTAPYEDPHRGRLSPHPGNAQRGAAPPAAPLGV